MNKEELIVELINLKRSYFIDEQRFGEMSNKGLITTSEYLNNMKDLMDRVATKSFDLLLLADLNKQSNHAIEQYSYCSQLSDNNQFTIMKLAKKKRTTLDFRWAMLNNHGHYTQYSFVIGDYIIIWEIAFGNN